MNRRGFLGLLAGVAAAPLCRGLGAAEIPPYEIGAPMPDPRIIQLADLQAAINDVMADVLMYGSGYYKNKPDGTIEHIDALSVLEHNPDGSERMLISDTFAEQMYDDVVNLDTGGNGFGELFDVSVPYLTPRLSVDNPQ